MRCVTGFVGAGVIVLGAASGAELQEHAELVAAGQKVFLEQGCHHCHTVGLMGTPIAPDLSRIGAKYPETFLGQWLGDPSLQRPTAHMPKLELTEAEIEALAAYLASLR